MTQYTNSVIARDAADRALRIARILDGAPSQAHFMGYGGSAIDSETLVFEMSQPEGETFLGYEVRIPVYPEHFTPAEVAREYNCVSGSNWNDIDA